MQFEYMGRKESYEDISGQWKRGVVGGLTESGAQVKDQGAAEHLKCKMLACRVTNLGEAMGLWMWSRVGWVGGGWTYAGDGSNGGHCEILVSSDRSEERVEEIRARIDLLRWWWGVAERRGEERESER